MKVSFLVSALKIGTPSKVTTMNCPSMIVRVTGMMGTAPFVAIYKAMPIRKQAGNTARLARRSFIVSPTFSFDTPKIRRMLMME